jgi:aspartate 1-decarboxylase
LLSATSFVLADEALIKPPLHWTRGIMRKLVAGKLHGIRVTDANLNYHGSITLDPDHCEAAGILPMEFVEIWNKNSGARISTYVILGERGSRCCILNGAAARTCQAGDQVIICNSVYLDDAQITSLKPRILTFDDDNNIGSRLSYSVSVDAEGRYRFDILDDSGETQPIPLRA